MPDGSAISRFFFEHLPEPRRALARSTATGSVPGIGGTDFVQYAQAIDPGIGQASGHGIVPRPGNGVTRAADGAYRTWFSPG